MGAHDGFKGGAVLTLVRDGQGSHGSTVETVSERYELRGGVQRRLLGVGVQAGPEFRDFTTKLDRGLIRLRPAVTEEDLGGKRGLHQSLRKGYLDIHIYIYIGFEVAYCTRGSVMWAPDRSVCLVGP